MIRAVLEATGAVVWACWLGIMAVAAIGLLRASWRDWRTTKCRSCGGGPVDHPGVKLYGQNGEAVSVTLCNRCLEDTLRLRCLDWRIPREVMG